nr:immunoglobulin light chain junction region [Macaca mulatta]MOW59480.1 immunoglobulin light chain junction region [Macaca mulatta]
DYYYCSYRSGSTWIF